ncbi:MAG TPA: PIN domain-containing protein [Nitrosopumilus sp.]|nr:PIN domain-containing protein [Nitrosopumilus sp.]
MDFRILDASAFYAGVPFRSSEDCYTTSLVYDEIQHIKKSQDVLGTLIETNRLKIREPDKQSTQAAIKAAKETGDFPQLSKQDVSIIALGLETKGQIITDDFAISNVAKNMGLDIAPIMTKGIKDVGKWIHYCPGCKTSFKGGKECSNCGTALKRKLIK